MQIINCEFSVDANNVGWISVENDNVWFYGPYDDDAYDDLIACVSLGEYFWEQEDTSDALIKLKDFIERNLGGFYFLIRERNVEVITSLINEFLLEN